MTSLLQETPSEVQRSIENHREYWRVYSASFEETYHVKAIDLARKLLPDLPQEKHIKSAVLARDENRYHANSSPGSPRSGLQRGEGAFHIASMPCYHYLFRELYLMQEGEHARDIERIRRFLEKTMDEYELATLTHLRPEDIVVHDVGLPNQREERVDITLSERDSLEPPEVCRALLGSEDTEEIENIYSWLRPDRSGRFCLPTQRREYDSERIIAFEEDTSWGIIGTAPDHCNHALGIRFVTLYVEAQTRRISEKEKSSRSQSRAPSTFDIEIEEIGAKRVYSEDELNHRLSLAEQGGHVSPEKASIVRKILLGEGETP